MSLTKNEVMNEIYNAGLVTLGAVATSVVSKKLMKDDLGVTSSAQRLLKQDAYSGVNSACRENRQELDIRLSIYSGRGKHA